MSNMAIDVKHGKCKELRLDEKSSTDPSTQRSRHSTQSVIDVKHGRYKVKVDITLNGVDIKHDSQY